MGRKNELDEVLAVQKRIEEKAAEIRGIKDTIAAEQKKSVVLASGSHDLDGLRIKLEDAKAAKALGADVDEEIKGLELMLSEAESSTESFANAHKKAQADFTAVSAGLTRVLARAEQEMSGLKRAKIEAMERFLREETERIGGEYASAVLLAEKALRQMTCLAEIHNKWFLANSAEIRPVFANMFFSAPMWHLLSHEEVKAQSPFWDQHLWKFPIDGGSSTWLHQGIEAEKTRLSSLGVDW